MKHQQFHLIKQCIIQNSITFKDQLLQVPSLHPAALNEGLSQYC